MKNWKITFGGALSALGSALAGVATVGAYGEATYGCGRLEPGTLTCSL